MKTLITGETWPETFEEWVKIHGEPDYIEERETRQDSLDINIIDNSEGQITPERFDPEELVWQGKRGGKHIDYAKFVQAFEQANDCVFCNGAFYTPEGMVDGGELRSDIYKSLIDLGWTDRADTPTDAIFKSLQTECYVKALPTDENTLPFANGDMHTGSDRWEFHLGEKKQVSYRFSVDYCPYDKPMPLFDKWLHDLFEEDDILTIQEIFGYCLVPVTAAQEAFFLVGDGGTGKSGMGKILKGLLGNAYREINTQELISQRFQMATVENRLVAYDDDLGSAALEETGTLKKLITADTGIPAERKYGDPYTFMSYCRIIACTNFMLSSLYDDSDGFFRRLHPILVKPRDKGRKDIPRFYDIILAQEKEQIMRWALKGLKRVQKNNWEIHWSNRSKDYFGVVKSSGNHFDEFFNDVFDIRADGDVTSAEIKKLYARWCRDNAINPASDRRLWRWFSDSAERKGIKFSYNLKRDNKHIRGYQNIAIKGNWLKTISLI